MNQNNLALDSIDLIYSIIETSSNFSDLSAFDQARYLANRNHLIYSLNNETQEKIDQDTIEKIQQCLNNTKNYHKPQ